MATAWVRGCSCSSSKKLTMGLDMISLGSHRSIHPSEDMHSANNRE